jgi:hypothetical protein
MGHYCYSCDEKLIGGVVSSKCDCIECFCQKCWDTLFESKFEIVSDVVYYKNKGCETFSSINKTLYEKVDVKKVECPECHVEWDQNNFEDF